MVALSPLAAEALGPCGGGAVHRGRHAPAERAEGHAAGAPGARGAATLASGFVGKMAMGQNPNPTPSEHPNPHENRLKWVVHLPQNGTIGFDPQPNGARATGGLEQS